MASEIKGIFHQIDLLIKGGKGHQATTELERVDTRKLQAEERVMYAFLARRLSLPNLSIKLLKPIVRPVGRVRSIATDGEKAEYAGALIAIGAVSEALGILNALSDPDPNTLLLKSFAHISEWNYPQAIPLLLEYIEASGITDYQRLVGEVNLCDSLAFVQDDRAIAMMERALREATEGSYQVLLGRLYLTQIDFFLSRGDLKKAEVALSHARKCYHESPAIEAFYVKKWEALVGLYQKGCNAQTSALLEEVRKEAGERWQDWETVRDCDFHQAIQTKDHQLMLHLFHGTPHESFRKRLSLHWPELASKSQEPFLWKMARQPKGAKNLQLFSGVGDSRRNFLNSGSLNVRFLTILTLDFYRPIRTATLASLLYPDEFFNYVTSPNRVQVAVFQLRKWIKQNGLPLEINKIEGAYRLGAKANISLDLHGRENHRPGCMSPELYFLQEALSTCEFFSAREACKALSISPRTAHRLLNEGIEKGILKQKGKGPSVRYSWVRTSQALKSAA